MATDEVMAKIAAEEAEFQARMDETVVDGFKVGDMRAMFNRITNPKDWRSPIRAWITQADLRLAERAVEYFTATELTVVRMPEDQVPVRSIGYRMGPAGDH